MLNKQPLERPKTILGERVEISRDRQRSYTDGRQMHIGQKRMDEALLLTAVEMSTDELLSKYSMKWKKQASSWKKKKKKNHKIIL
jgi:hypothetical protein